VLCAAGPVAADPLPSNDYQIDLFQGPLLLPIRVESLGGSYAGYAEEISGLVANAAAPAVRETHGLRHIELDLSGSFSIPLDLFDNNDFDNSGDLDAEYSDFVHVTGGVNLQVGRFGAGMIGDVSTYQVADESGVETAVVVGRYHALVAANFVEGQLCLGAGARALSMGFDTPRGDFFYVGAGPQAGVLVRPNGIPFRFGGTYRAPVSAQLLSAPASQDGLLRAGDLVLPGRVVQPWEVEVGVAVQVGPRPLNVPFRDPEDSDDWAERRVARARAERLRERERDLLLAPEGAGRSQRVADLDRREADLRAQEDAWLEREERYELGRLDDVYAALPRQRLLLLLALVASGPVERGVSFEKFLGQNQTNQSASDVIGSAGAETNFSPRFGVEAEPVENRLVVRAGSYYEPSRFGGVGRQHFTFGALLNLFTTDVFGLLPELSYGVEAGMDLAPRYQSVSATVTVFR
jgi:hypothetical protein